MKYAREQALPKNQKSLVHWMFINLISQKGLNTKEWGGLQDATEFNIELKIEGVEVDFVQAILDIEKQIDDMERSFHIRVDDVEKSFHIRVGEEALVLFEQKFSTIIEATKEVLRTTQIEQLEYLIQQNKEEGNT